MSIFGENSDKHRAVLTEGLTIIYVNYHSAREIDQSLRSVLKYTAIDFKVVVVNNSSEEDLTFLKEISPGLKLIALEANYGFGKACNLAIEQADTEFVLLLNPDTRLTEDAISKSLAHYQTLPTAQTGALTCKHLHENGEFQYSAVNRTDLPVFPFLRLRASRRNTDPKEFYDQDDASRANHSDSHYTFGVHGSFFLCRRQDLLNTPFDEDFFLYGEELDVCRRLVAAGKKSYYYAGTSIIHTATRAKGSEAIRHQNYLSTGLLVLKFYGRLGFLWYHMILLLRSACVWALMPFVSKKSQRTLKTYLADFRPLSRDHFKVLRYRRNLNSHQPLISERS